MLASTANGLSGLPGGAFGRRRLAFECGVGLAGERDRRRRQALEDDAADVDLAGDDRLDLRLVVEVDARRLPARACPRSGQKVDVEASSIVLAIGSRVTTQAWLTVAPAACPTSR